MTFSVISELAGLTQDVSRETTERLASYEAGLKKWSARINLVSPKDLSQFYTRHLLDSAQLFSCVAVNEGHWADLGSGGGLPGLVIAILAAEKAPELRMSLVESDQRKAVFLMTMAHELGLNASVHSERIEKLQPLDADVISARALAPLDRLLGYATRHLKSGGTCIFPKGATYQDEIAQAQRNWDFQLDVMPSCTQSGAAILKIQAPSRRAGNG